MTYFPVGAPGQEVGERTEDEQYEWDGEEWVPTDEAMNDLLDDLDATEVPSVDVGTRSQDGQYEWDGEEWVPTDDAINGLIDDLDATEVPSVDVGTRSQDGQYEWDGNEWVPTDDAINDLVDELNQPVADGSEAGRLDDLLQEVAEEVPAWTPDDNAMGDAADGNQAALKATPDGGTVNYQIGGFMVLIGDVHPQHYFQYVQSRPDNDRAQGTITIEKGGFRNPGSLVISGCPPAKQGIMESHIGQFSKKAVKFR